MISNDNKMIRYNPCPFFDSPWLPKTSPTFEGIDLSNQS